MKDPKILMDRIWVIFNVICFLLALYMTLKNIGRFLDDTNNTTSTYKNYSQSVKDEYPGFSLCFEGDGLYRFNESAIFAAYGIDLGSYEEMLDGKQAFRYDYDPSSRRYSKISLTPNFEPNVGFQDHDLFQLPEIVKKVEFVSRNRSQSTYYGKRGTMSVGMVGEEPPLYVSYQSSKIFCMTRQQNKILDTIRHYDTLILKPSLLYSNTRLEVFIHYPGHLLRSFDTPRLELQFSTLQDKKFEFTVSQTTILRKRSVKYNHCNNNIEDHDRFLLQSISNDTGCVPPYWKGIIGGYSSLSKCSSPEQLRKVQVLSKNYKKISESRDAPCLDMFNSIMMKEAVHNDIKLCKKCTYIKIEYLDKYYEEIKEIEDFTFEDFISGLGGFIGIFLGYSMLQVPQLLGISVM